MKTILFCSILTLLTLQSFSQKDSLIAKNRKFISMELSLSTSKSIYANPIDDKDRSDYNGLGGNIKISSGKFISKGIARIFSLGIGRSGGNFQNLYSSSSSTTHNLFLGYALERYLMVSSKFGVFGGVSGGFMYSFSSQLSKPNESITIVDLQNDRFIEQSNSISSSSIDFKVYTGITYFISSKWALSAIVGGINLISISHNQNYSNSQILKSNNDILSIDNTSSGNRYNFNPSFVFNNSGFTIRYFIK